MLLLQAFGYICAVSLCKALMSITQNSSALLWREGLTLALHAMCTLPARSRSP